MSIVTAFEAWVGKYPWMGRLVYADGLSSMFHALVVLGPSVIFTLLLGGQVGSSLGILWAGGGTLFYTKRELSDWKRFKGDREKRKDTIRDFAFPLIGGIIGVGMGVDKFFG